MPFKNLSDIEVRPKTIGYGWYLKIPLEHALILNDPEGTLLRPDHGTPGASPLPGKLRLLHPAQGAHWRGPAPILRAGRFMVLNRAAAEALGRFDLGRSRSAPVAIVQPDRTQLQGAWSLLDIAERKYGFDPDLSHGYIPNRYGHQPYLATLKPYMPNAFTRLNASVLEGVALWSDPAVNGGVFVSASVMRALRQAEVTEYLQIISCSVIRLSGPSP